MDRLNFVLSRDIEIVMAGNNQIDYSRPIKVSRAGLVHERDRDRSLLVTVRNARSIRILISAFHIARRIRHMARAIVSDAGTDKLDELQLVVILKGAAPFAMQLAREIMLREGPPLSFHYLAAVSYGRGTRSSGVVKIDGTLPNLKPGPVLIIEDIVDTGLTILKLKQYLKRRCRSSVIRICTLMDKPACRSAFVRDRLQLDYVGFSVPNVFVAGYGLDYREHLRELPHVVEVKPRRADHRDSVPGK